MSAQVLAFPQQDAPPIHGWAAITDAILAWDREHREYEPRDTWKASSLGHCLRRQMWQRKKVPETQQITPKSLRRFMIGNLIEDAVVNHYERAGLTVATQHYVLNEEISVSGRLDLIARDHFPMVFGVAPDLEENMELRVALSEEFAGKLGSGNTGIEVKSAVYYGPWRDAYDRYSPPDHYKVQVGAYMLLHSLRPEDFPGPIDRWELLVIFLNDGQEKRFKGLTRWMDDASQRIEELNYHWEQDGEPPCTCLTDMGGKGWRYCPYWSPKEDAKTSAEKQLCCGRSV